MQQNCYSYSFVIARIYLYIYALVSSVNAPHGMVPPGLGPGTRSQHEAVQDYFPYIFPLFPHLVESPANTIGVSTCKGYDPYQPSITPTRSHHRSTGGGVQTM